MANVLTPSSISELQRSLYLRAKLHPDGQFQDLYDAICREDVLQHAYLLCRARNTHAPGVDGQSLADIATYGARKWLKELELDLTRRTYRPSALLRVSATLPDQSRRSAGVPTIRDEVCMTATMLVLEPIVASWQIVKPESVQTIGQDQPNDADWKQAIEARFCLPIDHNAPGWHQYLTGVPHAALTLTLALRIVDRRVLDLFVLWLACPIESSSDEHGGHQPAAIGSKAHGVSTDLPISPLLTYLVAPRFLLTNRSDQASQRQADERVTKPQRTGAHAETVGHPPPRMRHDWTALREPRLVKALLLSLLLHAALLAIEFGELGVGLPLIGLQSGARQANVSVLNATLKPVMPPEASAPLPRRIAKQQQETQPKASAGNPPSSPTDPVQIAGFKAQVRAVKAPNSSPPEVPAPAKKPRKTQRASVAVLSTTAESTWSAPLAPSPADVVEQAIADLPTESTEDTERNEKERLEALARIDAENAQRAAAKAEQDRLAQQRVDELARNEAEKRKQVAAAKASEEALARAELEDQRQAKLATAKEEAAARQAAQTLAMVEAERIKRLAETKAAEALASERAAREDALAKQRLAELARIEAEKLKLAAAKAKAEELARAETERQRQAAIDRAQEEAQARQRSEALARIEAEKAKQLIEAKAAAERIAKQAAAEAEALARERAIEAAVQAKKLEAERGLAAERAKAELATTLPTGTGAQGALSPGSASAGSASAGSASAGSASSVSVMPAGAGSGRDLASRALDTARSSSSGFLPTNPPDIQVPRRASILGRDPKDIQLAFYGDGWRQKVERVGAMNFPKLSKFLVYDPMVVTVSINSDGTLAGVRIVKSSGHIDLDNAVRQIIEMSAPFAAFPPSLKRSFDVADITRTWVFVGDRPQLSGE